MRCMQACRNDTDEIRGGSHTKRKRNIKECDRPIDHRLRDKQGWTYLIFSGVFKIPSNKTKIVNNNMWCWGCGWIEAVSAVILLRVRCRKVYSFVSDVSCMWCFQTFQFRLSCFFLTGTFPVQPLSGNGWWYVYNFDWYPKCPKWSALSRNVAVWTIHQPLK